MSRNAHLRLGALLHRDPVLSVRAQVHLVRANKVMLLGLFGDGALSPDGRDEPEEAQVHLEPINEDESEEKVAKAVFFIVRVKMFTLAPMVSLVFLRNRKLNSCL